MVIDQHSIYIKDGAIFKELSNYQLLKQDSALQN